MIYLDQRTDRIARAQRDYITAMAEAKNTLIALIEDIAEDPLIQQNVDWGLNNSVSKRLQAQLANGRMDAVFLANSDCSSLAFAKIGKNNFQDCESLGSASGFHWYLSDEGPVLAFSKSIKRGDHDSIFIQGHLALSEGWRNQLGLFSSPWNSLHLAFETWSPGPSKVLPIIIEGPSKSGQMIASVSYRANILDSYLGGASGTSKADYLFPMGLLIAALGVLGLIQLTQYLQDNSLKAELQGIQALLQTHSSGNLAKAVSNGSKFMVQNACGEILQAIKDNGQSQEVATAKLMQKIRLLTEEKTRIDNDHAALAGKFSELNRMESLGQQLTRSSNFMLENVSMIQETAQDLRSILSAGLEENGKFVCRLMTLWKEKIDTRGARKFLRSLSETDSEIQGVSALDEQLSAIFTATQALTDQAIGARLHSVQIIDKTQILFQHAARWKGLIDGKEDAGVESFSLKSLAVSTNALLQADSQVHNWTIAISKDHVFPDPREIPVTIFVSAMYHAVLATYFSTDKMQKAELSLRYRKKDDNNLIVLSPPENLPEMIAFGSPGGQEQLALIKRLLAPFNIHCENLRLGPSFYPITFRWKDKVVSMKKPTDQQRSVSELS
jgi:hypothetical protein